MEESLDTFNERCGYFLGWAAEHYLAELVSIFPHNEIAFTEESAKQWLTLLREWSYFAKNNLLE